MTMNKINNLAEFYEMADSEQTTVFYFYTNWCPDCFRSKLYLSKLEEEYKDIKFYRVNRDKLLDLSSYLRIFGIPSFLMFKDGEEVGRFVSKQAKSYLEVKDFIDSSK